MGISQSRSQTREGFSLDCIISNAALDRDNVLYRLVNYRKGGTLVEAFQRGGSAEVEKLAREVLPQYMYQGGKGMVLMPDDFAQFFQKEESVSVAVDLPDTRRLSRKVCWRLDHRGLLGESMLHVLVLCNSSIHTKIALVLLRMFPALALDVVEGQEYHGATALHFSIAYQNQDLIDLLVDNGADVNQRATGRFFLPKDQQGPDPVKNTDYDGLFYMGEYPLAWAACCEDEETYNLLITRGADPNMPDMFGNMILHLVVIRDKLTMYGCALKHPTKPAKEGILNRQGLSPLSLSCKLGRNQIFREMMDLCALEFWRYSNITCSGYPLSALDTLLPNGKTNWNSALILILNGKTSEHLAMLDGGVIQKLLEEKWKTFARRYFLRRLALMLLHLFMLSLAVFLRPTTSESLMGPLSIKSICRFIAEIIALAGCFSFVIVQPIQEIMAQGLTGFLLNLAGNPAKVVFMLSSVFVMLCVPYRLILEDRNMEDFLLSLALPGSWFFLLFFAGAMRLTGPFVTMIYSMLGGDMVRFSVIYIVILIGFTQAFYFLFKSQVFGVDTRFTSYMQTWISLFQMTLGSFEFKELRGTYYKLISQLVFTLFMVMTPILLLNMLIAMMGNTYMEVIEQSEREYLRQWAKVLVTVERAISSEKARIYVDTYSIKLPTQDNEDPSMEQRAVLVIRARNKSKARQRKGALTNWKRLGKKIVRQLRKLDGRAETLRARFQGNLKIKLSLEEKEKKDDDITEPGLAQALSQLAFTHDKDLALDFAMQPPKEAVKLVVTYRDIAVQTFVDVRHVFVQTAEKRSHKCKKRGLGRRGLLGTAKVGDSSGEPYLDIKTECSKRMLPLEEEVVRDPTPPRIQETEETAKNVRFELNNPKYGRRQKFAESKSQQLNTTEEDPQT